MRPIPFPPLQSSVRLALECLSLACALAGCSASAAPLTSERIENAGNEPHNWLSYYGNSRGWAYSALDQINAGNAKNLVVKWAFQLGSQDLQVTPVVVDGVMYVSNKDQQVFALDARTGEMLWRYNYAFADADKMALRTQWRGTQINRGVTVVDDKVLLATWDAFLVALDAKSGKEVWKRQLGNYETGNAFSAPPLIAKDKAILGVMTGEMPNRGYIVAVDVKTGAERWRFWTVPAPDEPGNETWAGDSWKHGCGAAWMTGTFDAHLNLVYFGTGNPCAYWDGEPRAGDNLYTSSTVALDADSGMLKWHFQAVPHDVWDLDNHAELVLVDIPIEGTPAKVGLQAGKNGFFYVLDRTTGEFILAKPFVDRINWTSGLDERGRPVPHVVPTAEGAVLCPGANGARGPGHTAYSPRTGYVYIPVRDMCTFTKVVHKDPEVGKLFLGGEGSPSPEGSQGYIAAVDAASGETKWRYRSRYPMSASVLVTGSDLLFTGDIEGYALALDARSGRLLWRFNTGSGVKGSPISYAVDGRQYVAIPSGQGGLSAFFWPRTYPELANATRGSTLFVFGLPEE